MNSHENIVAQSLYTCIFIKPSLALIGLLLNKRCINIYLRSLNGRYNETIQFWLKFSYSKSFPKNNLSCLLVIELFWRFNSLFQLFSSLLFWKWESFFKTTKCILHQTKNPHLQPGQLKSQRSPQESVLLHWQLEVGGVLDTELRVCQASQAVCMSMNMGANN